MLGIIDPVDGAWTYGGTTIVMSMVIVFLSFQTLVPVGIGIDIYTGDQIQFRAYGQ